jgi:hypothetical protein
MYNRSTTFSSWQLPVIASKNRDAAAAACSRRADQYSDHSKLLPHMQTTPSPGCYVDHPCCTCRHCC